MRVQHWEPEGTQRDSTRRRTSARKISLVATVGVSRTFANFEVKIDRLEFRVSGALQVWPLARWLLYFLSGLSLSIECFRLLAMPCLVPGAKPVPSKDSPFAAHICNLRSNTNTRDLRVRASQEFDSDDEMLSTDSFLALPLHPTEHTGL